jgi:hypothetical protein
MRQPISRIRPIRDFGVRRNPRALVAWRWGMRGICGHPKIRWILN